MRIHYLQHVPFEGLGTMARFFEKNASHYSCTHCYKNTHFPPLDSFDLLVIMGGPMGVYDDTAYPWLKSEKKYIKAALDADKYILGICLGAQLLADALGAAIKANDFQEIGWHKVYFNPALEQTMLKDIFRPANTVFHWHSDTFELPENSISLGHSNACKHQGFVLGNKLVGLQFHLETNPDWVRGLCMRFPQELNQRMHGPYVQSAPTMLGRERAFKLNNILLNQILMRFKQAIMRDQNISLHLAVD